MDEGDRHKLPAPKTTPIQPPQQCHKSRRSRRRRKKKPHTHPHPFSPPSPRSTHPPPYQLPSTRDKFTHRRLCIRAISIVFPTRHRNPHSLQPNPNLYHHRRRRKHRNSCQRSTHAFFVESQTQHRQHFGVRRIKNRSDKKHCCRPHKPDAYENQGPTKGNAFSGARDGRGVGDGDWHEDCAVSRFSS